MVSPKNYRHNPLTRVFTKGLYHAAGGDACLTKPISRLSLRVRAFGGSVRDVHPEGALSDHLFAWEIASSSTAMPFRLSAGWGPPGWLILDWVPSEEVAPKSVRGRFSVASRPLVVDFLVRDGVHRPLRPPPIAEIDLTHRFPDPLARMRLVCVSVSLPGIRPGFSLHGTPGRDVRRGDLSGATFQV
jgi:hypothetical protein